MHKCSASHDARLTNYIARPYCYRFVCYFSKYLLQRFNAVAFTSSFGVFTEYKPVVPSLLQRTNTNRWHVWTLINYCPKIQQLWLVKAVFQSTRHWLIVLILVFSRRNLHYWGQSQQPAITISIARIINWSSQTRLSNLTPSETTK